MADRCRPTPINCSVRQPIVVRLDDSKSEFRSGLVVVEVKFPNILRAEVGEIHFKNYYAASVVVKMKERGGMVESVENKWKTVVKKMTLMPHPHCETGSQDFFSIRKKQMLCELDNLMALRFILYQPSPVWKDFRIEELQMYKKPYDEEGNMSLPTWLTLDGGEEGTDEDTNLSTATTLGQKNVQNNATISSVVVPNIDRVAQSLQQMWALAEKVKPKQNSQLKRYDIDGSYDINLLSYT